MNTTSPASPSTPEPEIYVPGLLIPKLLYLALGALIFAVGFGYLWEPLGRYLYGHTGDATVARIVRTEPGVPDTTYTFRQEFPSEHNWSVVFQHYVVVPQLGRGVQLRMSVDSRRQPNYNINDHVLVCYYPGDTVAFDFWNARTWGIGTFFSLIGLIMVASGGFMVFNANRPIALDHQADDFEKALDEGHPPPADPEVEKL